MPREREPRQPAISHPSSRPIPQRAGRSSSRSPEHPTGGKCMSTLRRLVLVTLIVAVCPHAHAQSYPAKPVRLIVGFAPGGGTDILARTIGAKLTEYWGQQVV